MRKKRGRAAARILLLCCCGLLLGGCAISPPDSLKRTGVNRSSLISASTAGLAPDEKQVTLYFRFGDTGYLAPEPRIVVVQRNESLEKAVVGALIAGPVNAGLSPLFPPGTETIATSVQDRTLFVTFSEDFLGRYADEPADASAGPWKTEGPLRRQLCLDALAATLTEAGLCDRVQVMVARDSGQTASMRLQAGFLDRSGEGTLLPAAARNEQALLTPHNTAACLLQAWREQNWAALSPLVAETPGAQSSLNAFSAAGALVDFELSPGNVAFDGQTAVLSARLTLLGEGRNPVVESYPLRLVREDGLWKMRYDALLQMMNQQE